MYQKLVIVGNLGNDPEMRYMSDGTAVTNFSVATNRQYSNRGSGEMVKETTWFRVSVWGRQAEACHQYLNRGSSVLVEGRLQVDLQTGGPKLFTRRDGTSGASFEIRAETVQFMSSRDNAGSAPAGGDAFEGQAAAEEEDDIPF